MTFGSPMAAWWFLVALPIVGMFFFRRRPVEVEMPSILFWEAHQRSQRATWIGDRFSRWLTLLVQLLILAFLVSAMTDPNPLTRINHLIVVLDDSATMQTVGEEGRTRFDLAKSAVLKRIEAVPAATLVTVVLAGEPPTLFLRRQGDRTLVSTTLSELSPRDVNADITGSLTVARGLTLSNSSAKLMVVTDAPRPSTVTPTCCEWIRIGTSQPNVGISKLEWVEESSAVSAIITHRGLTGEDAVISLFADDQEIVRQGVTLSDQSTEVLLRAALNPGQPFEVRVQPPDALPLDNTAYGIWPERQEVQIQLVTNGSIPLLAAVSQSDAVIRVDSWDTWDGGNDSDLVILDAPPSGRTLEDKGRFLLFGGSDPFGRTVTETSGTNLKPTQWAPMHTLLDNVYLPAWRIKRSAGMNPPDTASPIVEADRIPLVFTFDERSGNDDSSSESFVGVYVNFSLEMSNLSTRLDFPIFVWNAIDFLLHRSSGRTVLAYSTGLPCSIPIAIDPSHRVTDPSGSEISLVYGDQFVTIVNPTHSGLYRIEGEVDSHLAALNWVPDAKQSTHKREGIQSNAKVKSTDHSLPRMPLWWILLVLLLGVAISEQCLFHRNVLRMN